MIRNNFVMVNAQPRLNEQTIRIEYVSWETEAASPHPPMHMRSIMENLS